MRNTWLSFTLDKKDKAIMFSINRTFDIEKIRVDQDNHIHMTTVFFGKKLKGLSKNRLTEINNILKTIILKYSNSNMTLEFDKFSMFPPNKSNLVVALYKPNINITNMVMDIKNNIVEASDMINGYTPHITIGKIINGSIINLDTIQKYPNLNIKKIEWSGDVIKSMDNEYVIHP